MFSNLVCETEEQNLVKELVAMSTRERIHAIRDLPMSFEKKKSVRCVQWTVKKVIGFPVSTVVETELATPR